MSKQNQNVWWGQFQDLILGRKFSEWEEIEKV